MFLTALLAASLCSPAPLPPLDRRTPEIWDAYLTNMLHDCFGHLSLRVADTPAAVSPLPTLAFTLFQVSEGHFTTAVLMEPAFLAWAPSPKHIAVILGHEATHIALFGRPMPSSTYEEFVADMTASLSVPEGACLLAEVYEWQTRRAPPDENTDVASRLPNLRPLCTAQRLLK